MNNYIKNTNYTNCPISLNCPRSDGCSPNVCSFDFEIKRFDTLPVFKYKLEDENGDAVDLTGLVVEASMWINVVLKRAITAEDTELQFANCVGFEQLLVGDLLVIDRTRSPENMLITGFDEENKIVYVERGVNGTNPSDYKKNTKMKGFRFRDSPGSIEMIYGSIMQLDGTYLCDQLLESYLVYNFSVENSCAPGCFCFEFKLLTLDASSITIPSVIPECFLGVGVIQMQKFPACGSFSVKVCDSPTREI